MKLCFHWGWKLHRLRWEYEYIWKNRDRKFSEAWNQTRIRPWNGAVKWKLNIFTLVVILARKWNFVGIVPVGLVKIESFFSHFILHMCKVIKVRQWKIIMFNFPPKIVDHWRRWKIYSSQVGELSVNSINYLNNFSNHELLETLDFEQRNLEIWKTLYWRRLFNESI